jgi:transcription initiation factor TFIIB
MDDLWASFKEFDEFDENGEQKSETLNDTSKDEEEEKDGLEGFSCGKCGHIGLLFMDGAHYCGKCGAMKSKELSSEAEYRFYGDSDNKGSDPTRAGPPINDMFPEGSLGTNIAVKRYESANLKKIAQYNSWNRMPFREYSLYKICTKIANVSKTSGLAGNIIERSKEIYRKIREVNISRGTNREGLIAACVWAACKDESVPRSTKEIASMFGIDLKDMTRGIKKFREVWRQANTKDAESININSSNPLHFIDRFCSNLGLNEDIKNISEFIAVKAISMGLVIDNTAPSIAAGSIFLACCCCEPSITKKQVAQACLISEVTISKCYKKLFIHKLNLFPKQAIKKYNITD